MGATSREATCGGAAEEGRAPFGAFGGGAAVPSQGAKAMAKESRME